MKYIAHEYDGKIYVIEAATLIGVYIGVGWEVFDTMDEVRARWSGLPLADDQAPIW